MIKSVCVKNFQSHADNSTLTLAPGVNVVVGQSDSGKTAIIRALKWLATNRPLGNAFKSLNGKGDTTVKVELDDDVVIHEPGTYVLESRGKRDEWNAIGTGVPETVTQMLNLSDLSWQDQMDAPFLLSASAGEVARTLNDVADLDRIDTALSNINGMLRTNRMEMTEAVRAKQSTDLELADYRSLDRLIAEAERLLKLETKLDYLNERVELADELIKERKVLDAKAERQIDPGPAEEMLDLLMDFVGQRKEEEARHSTARMMRHELLAAEAKLAENTKTIERLEKKWQDEFPDQCPLCGQPSPRSA